MANKKVYVFTKSHQQNFSVNGVNQFLSMKAGDTIKGLNPMDVIKLMSQEIIQEKK